MNEVVIGLITSGIAYVLGLITKSASGRFRAWKSAERSRKSALRRHPRYISEWLVSYYRSHGSESDLFIFEDVDGTNLRTPLLMRPSWQLKPGTTQKDLLIQNIPLQKSDVAVNQRTLASKGRDIPLQDNNEPWNDLIASVSMISESADGPRLHIQVAEYYQYLSACTPLELETYHRAKSSRLSKALGRGKIRESVLPNVEVASRCLLGAQPLGMQVALVFRVGGRFHILIQRRSQNLSIHAGALAVVPIYGCQTTDLTANTEVDLFHNFLREMYEELYGGEEVKRKGKSLDATRFYDHPPIRRLIEDFETGRMEWHLLGFGFDSLNGEVDLMACALYPNVDIAAREWHEMEQNWESQDICSWDLFGPELSSAIRENEFSGGSLFAIARSRDLADPDWRSHRAGT